MSDLVKDREKRGIRLATLAGMRGNEIDDSHKRHYLAAADRQRDSHEKTMGMDAPRLMPPFDL